VELDVWVLELDGLPLEFELRRLHPLGIGDMENPIGIEPTVVGDVFATY